MMEGQYAVLVFHAVGFRIQGIITYTRCICD